MSNGDAWGDAALGARSRIAESGTGICWAGGQNCVACFSRAQLEEMVRKVLLCGYGCRCAARTLRDTSMYEYEYGISMNVLRLCVFRG